MGNTILIAVSIIVFFAGFGVASVVYYNPSNAPLLGHGMTGLMTSPEDMNQMMNDPNFRNQWMNFMITDTEHMKQWMQDDPQHVSLMIEKMKVDHNFMMGMTMLMLEDPKLRLQMIGHMTENPEAMQMMMNMTNSDMIMATMHDSDQIQMMEDMMDDMMERMKTDPELKQAMMEHMERMQQMNP